MGPRKKGPISPIVQSGNFEISSLAGFEPVTLRVTVGFLIHLTKFPNEIFFKMFMPNSKRFFTIFLLQSRQLDWTIIGDFFWKDKKQELSKLKDFSENVRKRKIYDIHEFNEVCEIFRIYDVCENLRLRNPQA